MANVSCPRPSLNENVTNFLQQKASKQLARANTATLNRTHAITLGLHIIFILYRLLFRGGSWWKYFFLSAPSVVIEYYLERLGRPSYTPTDELRSPGEDMEAKGVTEYLWDIVYVTWCVLGLVGIAGEWAWWLWVSALLLVVVDGLCGGRLILGTDHCTCVCHLPRIYDIHWHEKRDDAGYALGA